MSEKDQVAGSMSDEELEALLLSQTLEFCKR
jgi:hypothetical protein